MNNKVKLAATLAVLMALGGCGAFKGPKKTPTLGNRVPILVSENGAEADAALADVQVLLPPPAGLDAWPQPGGDPSKSVGHLTLGAAPAKLWSAKIRGGTPKLRLGAAPVVADGKLFVVDTNAVVTAFAADTGRKLWSAPTWTDKKNREARFGGGVSYDGGVLFATNGLGDIVAMSPSDGAIKWRAHPGGPLRGAPTAANGALYLLSQDNQLFAISQADGSVQWTASGSLESQGVFGVAAPAASRGTIVAGFSSGELNAYRYENGRTLWSDTLSRTSITTSVSSITDIDASPVIDRDRAYAIGEGGRMVALELTTGKRLWELNIAGISTPWIAGEWLFVSTDDGRMICLSRANGRIRWITDIGGFKNRKKKTSPIHWSGPVLASGRLIVVNSRGRIASVKADTGEMGAVIKGAAPFSLPPVVANNVLYVLDQKGRITAYR